MNKEITIMCVTLIVCLNGVLIVTGSPLSLLHYLCTLPLVYKLGKESKQ